MEISKIIQLKNLAEELIAEYEEDKFMTTNEDEKFKDNNNSIDEAIDEIHKIYVATNHIWYNDNIPPTKEKLKEELLKLVYSVKESGCGEILTGGLFVRDLEDGVLEFGYETSYYINK